MSESTGELCFNLCCSVFVFFFFFSPGGLLYVVFQELFSSSSPNKIYGKAFNKVKLDTEVRMGLQLNKVKRFLFLLSIDTTSVLSYRDHASHAMWMLTLKNYTITWVSFDVKLQVIGAFGEPIKCYGETTRRGRRQQVRWEFWLLARKSKISVQYLF